ncbi:MAG: DNA repair protein RecO [Candidatus Latescibacterota bacterium]|nr:MAG: DNA repair protein RecO [Candidatus Latescibacterota bacterium]
MLKKDDGVVLRAARSGETSKIVTFLGTRNGKIRLIAKGALGGNSAFRGALEPGSHLEIVFYHKENRTVFFLREAHVHSVLRTESLTLPALAAALAVLELLDQVCFPGSPEPAIVELLLEYLRCPIDNDPLFSFLVFQYHLLVVLGALPDWTVCATCSRILDEGYYIPAEGLAACRSHAGYSSRRVWMDQRLTRLAATINKATLSELRKIEVAADTRKDLGAVLHWTYTYHVNNYRLPEALKLIPKDKRTDD